MTYSKTQWVNGTAPPISAENLNKIEDALESHDEDISDLKSDLSDEPIADKNKSFTIVENSQVTSTTGVISASDSHSRSDYTDLEECEYITLEGSPILYINYCLYDENKTYIRGSATNLTANIVRPSNAKYIIFTTTRGTIGNAELHLHNVDTVISGIENRLQTVESSVSVLESSVSVLEQETSITAIADKNKSFVIVENSQVSSGTGIISESGQYSRSDYTDLEECEYIALTHNSFINICFYDSEKNYISGTGTWVSTFTRPSNAVYAIFTYGKNYISSVELHLHNVPTKLSSIYAELDKKIELTQLSDFDFEYINESTLLQNVIGVTKFPNNLVVPSDCQNNKTINYANGAVSSNQSNYFCTGFIPVTEGTTYKANKGRNYAWYDNSKTYITGASGTSIQNGIEAPENAEYIRFTVNKTTDGISNPVFLYFTDVSSYQLGTVIDDLVVDAESKPWCYGKKINWIGDSIVDGADFDEEVCSALGLVKQSEYGINGSTIALNEDGTDGRNALCLRYSDMSNDADIIAVSCGTNDFQYAWCPIGTIESTENTTFYGALKTLCEGLINKYPQKLIFFTTPIKRAQAFASGAGGEYTADGVMTTPFSKNKYGKTLMDYADIIKEVCGYYSIPVLDMNRESLLNPHLASQQNMFDNVYTHPNATGQKIMARRVAGWLTQLGYNIE